MSRTASGNRPSASRRRSAVAKPDPAATEPLSSHLLGGHLLIASPAMRDAYFSVSVIYLCECNEQGALGLTLNRPLLTGRDALRGEGGVADSAPRASTIDHLLDTMKIACHNPLLKRQHLLSGGPVRSDVGFVLHHPVGEWESLPISQQVGLNTSKAMLETIADGQGPEQIQILLGCASWGAGQLEGEMAANAWLVLDEDLELIFHTPPEQVWQRAVARLDYDVSQLSRNIGHA